MILLDLFSGIGGFRLGFEKAGVSFEKVYFSEVCRHAIANYKYNFKNSQDVGAIDSIQAKRIEKPDVITFGSPYQNFSINGNGEGLRGDKSKLVEEAIRLVNRLSPGLFIWENVKGILRSNQGRDFYSIIQSIANAGRYRLEWQLVDTAWFLPQRRERLFLVGHLRGKSQPCVFPISADGRKTKKQRTAAAYCITASYPDNRGAHIVEPNRMVRHLTNIECERLQGFPDDWTKWGLYEQDVKKISKTNRYKLIGNAVTVDVVAAIVRRLIKNKNRINGGVKNNC